MAIISYREAVSQALREALEEDHRFFLMGEDIGPYGGSFAVTRGFWEEFGPERVKDSPLSESAIVGAGVGAAMAGLRPMVEIMTINFSLLAIDQIVNHAAKIRYMSGGQFSVPLCIRTVTGAGASVGATHSQSFEGWYASVPGLHVVVPSTPKDALGLFRSCRELMDPVIFVEHILLYGARGEVPDGPFKIPLGQAEVKRLGRDVTIVTFSRMVHVCLAAAEQLAVEGIQVEVVDLRTLRPLDMETVVHSVRKTRHALVVEEAPKQGGFGAEIASQVQHLAFDYLDGPVERVAGEEVPIPYSMPLERLAIPDPERVARAIRAQLGR
ncbi:MAG: alpha-ketoacid dehydrogenase subunit beta [SAR202 cluster bacterium]|nr:alpha-ketoacid dehydrogenase subunit beta [SAR202 cluster bacterium]